MDFFDVIEKRYSHRGAFLDKKVPREDIEKIINAGIKAPSALNENSTSYVVVDDEELCKELGHLLPDDYKAYTAPLFIIVLSEEVVTRVGSTYEIENYLVATENLLLGMAALGYNTVLTDGMTRHPFINNGIRKILNIPEGKNIRALLPVGIPEKLHHQPRKHSFQELVTFNKFKK